MVKRSNVLYRFFYCGGGGGTFIIPGGGGTFIIPVSYTHLTLPTKA